MGELAKQSVDMDLQKTFAATAAELRDNEDKVLQDLIGCQGAPMDLGGYYHVDKAKADIAMNPSEILNSIVARLTQGPDARVLVEIFPAFCVSACRRCRCYS